MAGKLLRTWRARRDLNPQPSDPKNGALQNRMDSDPKLPVGIRVRLFSFC
jgi:hypothetical protein